MLVKENRLTKDKDFQKVFKNSRPMHSENLVLRNAKQSQTSNLKPQTYTSNLQKPKKLIPNSYKLNSRFGFVISNKINKLATRRNALKRQLRAIIEKNLPNIKTGYDIVITVKRDFETPYDQIKIKEQVEQLLKKMDLYTQNNN